MHNKAVIVKYVLSDARGAATMRGKWYSVPGDDRLSPCFAWG